MPMLSINPAVVAAGDAPGASITAPIEMLGGRPGVSVIDPSSPLTRVWYFDGKFLRAEHFRRDQEYVRALNALSNQSIGHGIVHGFEAVVGSGDSIEVAGGLALAPSGRVIHLPGAVSMSIATLLDRSTGSWTPAHTATPGTADFRRCPPDTDHDDPDVITSTRPLYLLTIAPAEALCGEEERFGQLCDDACATETDRSFAIEGARFRAHRLDLSFPDLGITVDERATLRSRAASSYFAAERLGTASRISGAGLQTSVWCAGAEGVGGEEVPLAVFDRSGSVTSWIDGWIARRELMETSPQRYWGWRFAMRPLDVFLAQVLQFQCQLLGVGSGGPSLAPGDPCAGERAALEEASDLLATLARGDQARAERVAASVERASNLRGELGAEDVEAAITVLEGSAASRLDQVRRQIRSALSGRAVSATGSVLIDRGFVDVPSAGYLPIDETRELVPQVRAMFGPGVDLRFCAVRPDFVPEALQEAQHMERISLTQGISDPSLIEEVDVLVPGGTVSARTTSIEAFDGVIRILPSRRRGPSKEEAKLEIETGSAMTLSAVAREQHGTGWGWTLTAQGEAPHRLSVADLVTVVMADVGSPTEEVADEVVAEEATAEAAAAAHAAAEAAAARAEELAHEKASAVVYMESDHVHDDERRTSGFAQRINREAVFARERAESVLFDPEWTAGYKVPPDRAIPPDEKRPVSMWIDVDIARDLRDIEPGDSTEIKGRATVYSRARTEPVLIDAQIWGELVVQRREMNSLGRRRAVSVVTTADVWVDGLIIAGLTLDPPPAHRPSVEITWNIGLDGAAGEILSIDVRRHGRLLASAEFADTHEPRLVTGSLDVPRRGSTKLTGSGEWATIPAYRAGREMLRVASTELVESPGTLDVGRPGRDLAEGVIDVIGAELGLRGRDPGFMASARTRMFGQPAADDGQITPGADWVMFHRRRVKECGTAVDRPAALRTARWYHAVVDANGDLKRYAALAGRFVEVDGVADVDAVRLRERLDGLDFELVDVVRFPEGSAELASSRLELRGAFSAKERGDALVFGAVGSVGTGDGVHVELARLSATTGEVADLVDTTQMTTRVLTQIPPEFQPAGTDTVIFTVGKRRRKVGLANALMVRADLKSSLAINAALKQLAEKGAGVADGFLEQVVGGKLDSAVASFEGDLLVNVDAVASWWGDTLARTGSYSIAARHLASPEEVALWKTARTEKLASVVGLGALVLDDLVEWELPGHDAVVIVTTGD